MVCVPCLVIPAILLFCQFIYNKIPFVKNTVQYFFPGLKIAEEKAKRDADEASAKHQAEFWASEAKKDKDAAANGKESSKKDTTNEDGAKQRGGASTSSKKKKQVAPDEKPEGKKSA